MTDSPTPDLKRDADLLDRIAGGDDAALGALYDVHAPIVYGLALRLTGDVGEAEDVVTGVFRLVWQQPLDAGELGVSVRAWLIVLCRRVAAERPRQPRLVGKSATARSLPTAAREGHEIVLALPTVEDVLRREHVSAALAELPESERAALDLVFFDGLSVYDAAQRLGIPSHSARALIGYSMHLLRTTLRPPVPS
jgi:RNA polymerase sigma-70 factor (ECF subfamily)